ncbi:MAG: hypothetical protein FVQ82_05700 [Planctomycetes bacterium]|nr:hypothetical protein [Planctomycetota bacterium]
MRNVLVIVAVIMAITAAAFSAGGNMGGGAGIETNPFLIEDMADFNTFADPNNSETYLAEGVYTKLACDPNLATETYTKSVIGYFSGIFDGDGHTISNITINITESDHDDFGLFRGISSNTAQVKNLDVLNCNITNTTHFRIFGLLCGYNGGTIDNCHASGSINGGITLGGLCGVNTGTISNCNTSVSITGWGMLGGLCGANEFGGKITFSYADGSVTGNDFIGGLSGKNFGEISKSFSSVSVTGDFLPGGVCGVNSNPGKIENCYATGAVHGTTGPAAGFCGMNDATITNCYCTGLNTSQGGPGIPFSGGSDFRNISNCFWNTDTSKISDPEGGLTGTDTDGMIGLTIIEMQSKSTFAGWDFVGDSGDGTDDIWDICEGTNYPRFVRQIAAGDYLCPYGVSFEDLGFLALHWLDTANEVDLTGDGKVDARDFAIFAQSWMSGIE